MRIPEIEFAKDHSVILHIITFTYERFPANRALIDSNWVIRSWQIARANCQTCRGQALIEAPPEHSGVTKNGPISPDGISSIGYEECLHCSLSRHVAHAQMGFHERLVRIERYIAHPFFPAPRKALFIPIVQFTVGTLKTPSDLRSQ